jgi:hypothetical protein
MADMIPELKGEGKFEVNCFYLHHRDLVISILPKLQPGDTKIISLPGGKKKLVIRIGAIRRIRGKKVLDNVLIAGRVEEYLDEDGTIIKVAHVSEKGWSASGLDDDVYLGAKRLSPVQVAPDCVGKIPEGLQKKVKDFDVAVDLGKVAIETPSSIDIFERVGFYKFDIPGILETLKPKYQEKIKDILGIMAKLHEQSHIPSVKCNLIIEPAQTGKPTIWYEPAYPSPTLHIQVILLTDYFPDEYLEFVANYEIGHMRWAVFPERGIAEKSIGSLLRNEEQFRILQTFLNKNDWLEIPDVRLGDFLRGKIKITEEDWAHDESENDINALLNKEGRQAWAELRDLMSTYGYIINAGLLAKDSLFC